MKHLSKIFHIKINLICYKIILFSMMVCTKRLLYYRIYLLYYRMKNAIIFIWGKSKSIYYEFYNDANVSYNCAIRRQI